MPPEEDRATVRGDLHTKLREDRFSGPRDMLADRHTHTYRQTDRQADRNIPLLYGGRVIIGPNVYRVLDAIVFSL